MDYFKKVEKVEQDLSWNIPEQKWGSVKVIGGSKGRFRAVAKTAEFLIANYPVEHAIMVLPDSLRDVLPKEIADVIFVGSTESGSLGSETELDGAMGSGHYNLIVGDLSKNAETGRILTSLLRGPGCPTVITRDAVDLVVEAGAEEVLENGALTFVASMAQLMKLLRAVYYPKMLLLSQSLVQVVEVLHKFTLSYPVKIVTLHNGQILVAEGGEVRAAPLEKSGYSPITIWDGTLAAKIAALNLYNPNNFMDATLTAIF